MKAILTGFWFCASSFTWVSVFDILCFCVSQEDELGLSLTSEILFYGLQDRQDMCMTLHNKSLYFWVVFFCVLSFL